MPPAWPLAMTARRDREPPGPLLIAGATGLVGRELVRLSTADPGWAPVHLVVRSPMRAPAGAEVTVADFRRLGALPPARAACCAIGTTLAQAGSREAFRAVDFDAVLAFARAARLAGVRRLAAVSALGADPRSRNFYSAVKGQAEQALADVGFETLVIVRPSLLAGDRSSLGQPARLAERLALAVTQPVAGLIPAAWRPIEAATVARAMLAALRSKGPGLHVLESGALQHLGAAPAPAASGRH